MTKGQTTANVPSARRLSYDGLMLILERGQKSHVVLRELFEKRPELSRQDKAFITRLTEGCIEHLYELDYILDLYSKTKTHRMKAQVRMCLRMAVYQLFYMDSVPDSAAINEAVKLTAKLGFSGLKGFVNGVLRSIAREKESISFPRREEDPIRYLKIRYSVPEWIIRKLEETYGEEKTEEILKAGLTERPLTGRINHSRQTEADTLALLGEQNIKAQPVEGIPGGVVLSGYEDPGSIRAFREGYLQIQDISSMLVGLAAAPEEGMLVLDVCAAPGGKSIHAADLLKGTGRVISRDLTEKKVMLIRENGKRCRLTNLEAQVHDALEADETLFEKADVVIADLPCSGMGIIGRKSDIKYKLTEENMRELAELQRQILSVIWRYVKPGGRLVYSTCTIFPEENRENAEWFSRNFPFRKEPLTDRLPERFTKGQADAAMVQLLPGNGETDGFFLSSFRRTDGE